MNVWDALFTTHPTEPPQFGSYLVRKSHLALLFLTIYLAYRYRDNKVCQRFFQIIQAIQLIALYSWYLDQSDSRCQKALPFYHCRLAMFVVLLTTRCFKNQTVLLLCLEPSGRLAAFVYPVPDRLSLPHTSLFCPLFSDI